jgi:hypothetical protein
MVAALGRDCVADSLFILSASDCAVPESLTSYCIFAERPSGAARARSVRVGCGIRIGACTVGVR